MIRLRIAVGLAALLTFAGAQAASAGEGMWPVPETGGKGMLRLTSSVYPLDIPYLAPGESFTWQVAAVLDGPESATATVELQSSGSLSSGPGAYTITAESCPVQWSGASGKNATLSCGPGGRRILAADSFAAGGGVAYPLGRFTTADQPWVRFRLERPAQAAGASGTLAFGIGVVAGDGEAEPVPADLSDTGVSVQPYLAAAAVLVGLGSLLALSSGTGLSRYRIGRRCVR